jgi:carbonic anhydrase/acetyltransferase-like protein (isoleucine patch superfamily)
VAIYALDDLEPQIDPTAYVHPEATVIGRVIVGPRASIWPGAVLRGDRSYIEIGADTSIQDGSVLHCTSTLPTIVGERCVVGHLVHLEGCTIESDSLVGSGSTVLHRAVIRSGAFVAAQALVAPDSEVPSGALALGVPAKIREGAANAESIAHAVEVYIANGARYAKGLRRLD